MTIPLVCMRNPAAAVAATVAAAASDGSPRVTRNRPLNMARPMPFGVMRLRNVPASSTCVVRNHGNGWLAATCNVTTAAGKAASAQLAASMDHTGSARVRAWPARVNTAMCWVTYQTKAAQGITTTAPRMARAAPRCGVLGDGNAGRGSSVLRALRTVGNTSGSAGPFVGP